MHGSHPKPSLNLKAAAGISAWPWGQGAHKPQASHSFCNRVPRCLPFHPVWVGPEEMKVNQNQVSLVRSLKDSLVWFLSSLTIVPCVGVFSLATSVLLGGEAGPGIPVSCCIELRVIRPNLL